MLTADALEGGNKVLLLGGIFLLGFGLLMICFPDLFYELTESWKSSAFGEPSDFYRWHTRIGGIVFALVGIVSLVMFFVT